MPNCLTCTLHCHSHLEQCVPSLLKQLDHRPCRRTSAPLASLPATTLPSQLRPSLPLSITVAAKAWNRSTYLQPTKLRHLCCSQLTTFCHMHASNVSSMHSISLLLEADATLELLCELLASGGTQVALLLLQLTPHTATFHQCLRMVTSVTAYLDADIVVATASCSCYRTLSTHDLDVSTSNNSNLVCRLTSTCMHQQHQLAIALEMGCLASELYHPAHMMDLSEELPSRERCLSSPASDTSDDAVSLCELP